MEMETDRDRKNEGPYIVVHHPEGRVREGGGQINELRLPLQSSPYVIPPDACCESHAHIFSLTTFVDLIGEHDRRMFSQSLILWFTTLAPRPLSPPMTQLWCNGQWLDFLDFPSSAMDRGSILGLGLFETLLALDGVPVFTDRHLARLHQACARLGWPLSLPDFHETATE